MYLKEEEEEVKLNVKIHYESAKVHHIA